MNSPQLLVWADILLYVDLHFWCGPTFHCWSTPTLSAGGDPYLSLPAARGAVSGLKCPGLVTSLFPKRPCEVRSWP